MTKLACLVVLASACAGNAPSVESQPARLDHLTYDAPASWGQRDSHSPREVTTTWLPDDNARKESLIVSRAHLQPGRPPLDVGALADLLVSTQRELPHYEVSNATPFTTALGMRGVRVETDFVPVGSKTRYHRIHAVMFDGDSLVHVLYTAQQPDAEHRAFDLIVNSVHGEA